MVDGLLHINGKPVVRQRIENYATRDALGRSTSVPEYLETLPNGVAHRIVEQDSDRGYWDNTPIYTVPPGCFFMMGDNRDNSTDSRDQSSVGYVPFENLVGRAGIIFFSIEENASTWKVWEWPWTVRWDRVLRSVE